MQATQPLGGIPSKPNAAIKPVGKSAATSVNTSMNWLSYLPCSVSQFTHRTDGAHVLAKIALCSELILNPTVYLGNTVPFLLKANLGFQSLNIPHDINFMLGGGAKAAIAAKDYLTLTARSLMTLGNIGTSLLFANMMSVISTSNISSKIAEVAICGVKPLACIANASLSRFILATSGAGFALYAAASLHNIYKEHHSPNVWISVLNVVAEGSWRIFFLFASSVALTTTSLVITGALGGIAAITASWQIYNACSGYCQRFFVNQTAIRAVAQSNPQSSKAALTQFQVTPTVARRTLIGETPAVQDSAPTNKPPTTDPTGSSTTTTPTTPLRTGLGGIIDSIWGLFTKAVPVIVEEIPEVIDKVGDALNKGNNTKTEGNDHGKKGDKNDHGKKGDMNDHGKKGDKNDHGKKGDKNDHGKKGDKNDHGKGHSGKGNKH